MKLMLLNQAPRDPRMPQAEIDSLIAQFRSYASPDTQIEYHFVEDFAGARLHGHQGRGLGTNGLHHVLNAPPLIAKCVWAAENGFDCVIQTNTFDPGVEGARLAVQIPVIGLLRTALAVASSISDRIGIFAPLASDIPSAWRSIRAYQMDYLVVCMRPLGIYSPDLAARKTEIFGKTVDLVRGLIEEKGAQCIIPLGARLIPYVVDPDELGKAVGVPVLNTTRIAISFAEMCVRLGIRHSPLAYPACDATYDDFQRKAYD